MGTITYDEVQELVRRLPRTKLQLAYSLLVSLTEHSTDTLPPQLDLLLRPPDERKRIMKQQAEEMVAHYEQTAAERELWQGGDFIDAD